MKSLRLLAPLALAAVLGAAPFAFSADGPPPSGPQPVAPPAQGRPGFDLLTIDFKGGTLTALLDAVNRNDGPSFNVLGEKADFAVEIPPFSVRQVGAPALAAALDALLNPRGYRLEQSRVMAGAAVFILRKRGAAEASNDPQAGGSRAGFQAFQLGAFLRDQSVDDIIGALRAAWALNPAHKPEDLRLQFHPPTNILFVSGSPEATNVVPQILSQLRRDPEAPPQPRPGLGARSPDDEARRRETIANEVGRRRDLRNNGAGPARPGNPVPPDAAPTSPNPPGPQQPRPLNPPKE